jgi:hypothetical protein
MIIGQYLFERTMDDLIFHHSPATAGFRVKGLQPIENVHDTARDPEYLA